MIGSIDGAAAAQTDAIQKQLDDLADAASDLRPIWPEVGAVFAERQRMIFATNSEGRWAPLTAATLIRKAQTSINPSAILVDTGLLRDTATSPRAITSSASEAEFGVPSGHPVRQYTVHHIRGNGVPQRSPLPKYRPGERAALVRIIRRRLQEAIEG